MDTKRVVFIFLVSVSLAVGVAVSIVGIIGFVGLIVPYTVKHLFKKSYEKLFLSSFLFIILLL